MAQPLRNLDLKRVVPPVAIVFVVISDVSELREWPQRLSQAGSVRECRVRLCEASRSYSGRRDGLREEVEVTRVRNVQSILRGKNRWSEFVGCVCQSVGIQPDATI